MSIELEIQILLKENLPLDQVGKTLIEKIESADYEWDKENLNSISVFLLKAGQPQILISFILKHIKDKKFSPPWGHLIEAISQLYSEIDSELIKIVKRGIKDSSGKYLACQTDKWDSLIAEMSDWRSEKNLDANKKAPLLKKELLEKLNTLRTQQLYIAEQGLLQKLGKMFPGDPDVQKEIQKAQERYAYEVLNRYSGLKKDKLQFEESQEKKIFESFSQSLIETAQKNPEMIPDFAIVAWMIDDYETSYQILKLMPDTISTLWMKTELQLKTRRYIELLESLVEIENTFSDDPETFFATALLRAQAFWGLGQKHTAIEILEGLLTSRPSYRSASVLLDLWRSI